MSAHQNPRPLQFFAVQRNFQITLCQSRVDVVLFWRPGSLIPDHHRSAAILAFRNHTLKRCIVHRMIFHLHGEALHSRIRRRPFGHCPGKQRTFPLQAEIIVQRRGAMFLNHIDQGTVSLFRRVLAGRLWSDLKVSLLAVFLQWHECVLSKMKAELELKNSPEERSCQSERCCKSRWLASNRALNPQRVRSGHDSIFACGWDSAILCLRVAAAPSPDPVPRNQPHSSGNRGAAEPSTRRESAAPRSRTLRPCPHAGTRLDRPSCSRTAASRSRWRASCQNNPHTGNPYSQSLGERQDREFSIGS